MSQKPSIVFVPGAWHRAETWDKVTSEMEARGYTCLSVTLPSTTGDTTKGLDDDVQATQEVIRSQTTQGRDVILVVHSYGGQVGSSAIKGFARKPHDGAPSDSSSAHVIGLAMMATGFTVAGKSFFDGSGGKPPPQLIADTEKGLATVAVDRRDMLYHDLPEDEGKLWVDKLTPQSLKSLAERGEHAYSGWKDVPCWFLVTAEDHALPADSQRMFVKMAQDAGADVTMREVQSSHSPMLSKPKETADFLLEATNYFVEKK